MRLSSAPGWTKATILHSHPMAFTTNAASDQRQGDYFCNILVENDCYPSSSDEAPPLTTALGLRLLYLFSSVLHLQKQQAPPGSPAKAHNCTQAAQLCQTRFFFFHPSRSFGCSRAAVLICRWLREENVLLVHNSRIFSGWG